jgi:hypothetical protein
LDPLSPAERWRRSGIRRLAWRCLASLLRPDHGPRGLGADAVRASLGGALTCSWSTRGAIAWARSRRRCAMRPWLFPTRPGPCSSPLGLALASACRSSRRRLARLRFVFMPPDRVRQVCAIAANLPVGRERILHQR